MLTVSPEVCTREEDVIVPVQEVADALRGVDVPAHSMSDIIYDFIRTPILLSG